MGDRDSVQDAAEERKHDRAERVEGVLAAVREDLGEHAYPVSSEDLAATYADQTIDLPNETESLGNAFERLDEEFQDEQSAYDALVAELGGDENLMGRPEGDSPATWGAGRADTQQEVDDARLDEVDYESSVERSRNRAREAQAEAADEESGEE